jgi:hypothetical protein
MVSWQHTIHLIFIVETTCAAILLLAFIAFIAMQQRLLAVIQPGNRRLRPGLVWLQLIPLFGLFWQFVVLVRTTGSIRNECQTHRCDRPALVFGLSFCVLNVAYFATGFIPVGITVSLMKGPVEAWFDAMRLPLLLLTATLICWILYWARLAAIKRLIIRSGQ